MKRHLARLERERIQRQYILISFSALLILVVGLVGYALIDQLLIQPNRAVAVVAGEKISLKEFQDQARLARLNLINQYMQLEQFAQFFGNDPNTQAYIEQSRMQITSQLNDANAIGQAALQALIEDKLIRQEAKRRGITVTAAEVDLALQENFGYYANGTPTPAPTYPVQPTSTLSPLQMTLVPPTATPTATATPTETLPTAEPTATATPEPTATATEILPTSTPFPTPTPLTEAAYQESLKTFLSSNPNISEASIRKTIEDSLYRQKVLDLVLADLPKSQEQVWARHILVPDIAAAQIALDRLNAGEDFAVVAQELSTDTGSALNGGDLGWFGAGQMVAPFEEAAFALEVGEISAAVQSQFGYHIIQALGHEDRPLDESAYDELRNTRFQEWLDEQRANASVEIYDNWLDAVPTTPTL